MFPNDPFQISNSNQFPQAGRLTMPEGTWFNPNPTQSPFSNPATAADGVFGAPSGGFIGPKEPNLWDKFVNWANNRTPLIQPSTPYQNGMFYDDKGNYINTPDVGPVQHMVAYDFTGNRYTYDPTERKYKRDETGIFNTNTQSSGTAPKPYTLSPTIAENLVNGAAPQTLSMQAAMQLYPGYSKEQLTEYFASRGYEFVPGQRGHSSAFVLRDPNAALSNYGPVDERGRPFDVNGASLERGERVTTADGTTYVGGAEHTNPDGTTVGQYAITVSQNINKKLEEKGAYKWVKKTVKDRDGNWVAVYSKVLRAPYTNRYRQQKEDQAQSPARANDVTYHQLVTMRANYG